MSPRRFLGGLLTASLLAMVVMPAGGAQQLRLEDPIRQQERWQRNFYREQREQTQDRERDEAILRGQEDILRGMRQQESEREADRSWREHERHEERAWDRQKRRDEHCVQGYPPEKCNSGHLRHPGRTLLGLGHCAFVVLA